jgi:hypothetical protein
MCELPSRDMREVACLAREMAARLLEAAALIEMGDVEALRPLLPRILSRGARLFHSWPLAMIVLAEPDGTPWPDNEHAVLQVLRVWRDQLAGIEADRTEVVRQALQRMRRDGTR